jgi:hypothetical protein
METIVQQLIAKFDIVKEIIQKINTVFNSGIELLNEFDQIETNFALNIGPVYILLYSGESSKIKIQSDFSQFLIAEDFSNELNNLINKILNVLKINKIELIDNNILVKKYKNRKKDYTIELQHLFNILPWSINTKDIYHQNINYNNCSLCANIMTIDSGKSELRCDSCGMIRELIGTVFDDTQFYSQEGQKAKSGTFNPNRHFQFWWSHILAKEPEEELGDKKDPDNLYGEKVLKQIRSIITRDHKVLQLLTVNDIRSILREIEKTDLNKNVPLILKKITGIGPPYIPSHITIKVENLFTKAIEIGERIKHNKRINRNYYPYYIYRIIEAITTEKDTELRRVLYYIYIQSKETVESDDMDWEHICEELKEIQYKPTDRTLGLKYNYS